MNQDEIIFSTLIGRAKENGIVHRKVYFGGDKSQYQFHRVINFILNLFYPKDRKDAYLTSFWTTIGFQIVSPKGMTSCDNWGTLAHELMHTIQAKRWTRAFFGFFYLWPISLGITLLFLCWLPIFWASGFYLSIWIVGWLCISSLFFIPQLPDYWRSRWELEAYMVSMCCKVIRGDRLNDSYLSQLAYNFYSMNYFIMFPNQQKVRSKIKEIAFQIENWEHPICKHPLICLIRNIFEETRKVSSHN